MMHYIATIGNAALLRTETRELLPGLLSLFPILFSSLSVRLFSLPLLAIIRTVECASTWLIVNSSLKLIPGSLARIWAEEWRMPGPEYRGGCRLFKYRDLFIDPIEISYCVILLASATARLWENRACFNFYLRDSTSSSCFCDRRDAISSDFDERRLKSYLQEFASYITRECELRR